MLSLFEKKKKNLYFVYNDAITKNVNAWGILISSQFLFYFYPTQQETQACSHEISVEIRQAPPEACRLSDEKLLAACCLLMRVIGRGNLIQAHDCLSKSYLSAALHFLADKQLCECLSSFLLPHSVLLVAWGSLAVLAHWSCSGSPWTSHGLAGLRGICLTHITGNRNQGTGGS